MAASSSDIDNSSKHERMGSGIYIHTLAVETERPISSEPIRAPSDMFRRSNVAGITNNGWLSRTSLPPAMLKESEEKIQIIRSYLISLYTKAK